MLLTVFTFFITLLILVLSHEFGHFLGDVAADSPSAQAGIKTGDQVIALNGIKLESVDQLVALIKEKAGEKIILTLSNEQNETRMVEVIPRPSPPPGQGALGVSLGSVVIANLEYKTPLQKIASG